MDSTSEKSIAVAFSPAHLSEKWYFLPVEVMKTVEAFASWVDSASICGAARKTELTVIDEVVAVLTVLAG